MKSLRFFALALLAFVSLAALAGPGSVGSFLESPLGRYFITQTKLGEEFSAALLGRISAEERVEALGKALLAPQSQAALNSVEARLARIEERLQQVLRERAGLAIKSSSATLESLPLTSSELKQVLRVLEEEFGAEFVSSLPRLGRASSSARARFEGRDALRQSELPSLKLFDQDRLTPGARLLLPETWARTTLANEEMGYRARNLEEVTDLLNRVRGRSVNARDVKSAFRSMLEGKVPASQIEARIAGLASGSTDALNRALGDLTLEEVGLMVHGGSPLSPKPGSLLDQYIKETGAKTVVRAFKQGPNSRVLGPPRLVVAVSEKSFKSYLKYFSSEQFLTHVHTPEQGTLNLAFRGKYGDYAALNHDLRAPEVNTLMPSLLLKSTEGSRAALYFDLGLEFESRRPFMREPWLLEGYCATGGYSSCTHWFGNIPIGDRLVTEYKFPGKVDNYAYNNVSKGPQIRDLRPYPGLSARQPGLPQELSAEEMERIQKVWKVPGQEQLADAVGLGTQNLRGELANPGYVAYSLIGKASTDRVPFVFLMVQDHRLPIPKNFDTHIEAH